MPRPNSVRTNAIRRFWSDRGGNFAMMTGVLIALLLYVVGFGVNVAQMYTVRQDLLHALDSALTSTGRNISTGAIPLKDAKKSIENFLLANGNGGLSKADQIVIDAVDVDPVNRTIDVKLHVDMPLYFPIIGMSKVQRIATGASTLYSDSTVEIGLMLDVTGSMDADGTPTEKGKRQTKLENLQEAATASVKHLLGMNAPGVAPRVRIALIPYDASVNIGPNLSEAIYADASSKKNPFGILGSILKFPTENPIGLKREPLGTETLNDVFNMPLKLIMVAHRALSADKRDNCASERKKDDGSGKIVFDPSDAGPDKVFVNRDARIGRNTCPTSEIIPLTADEKVLTDAIDKLKGGGRTAGHIGIQWTRYMLSPDWRDFLVRNKFPNAVPANYSRPSERRKVRKIAVLMTDGVFNQAYAGVPDRLTVTRVRGRDVIDDQDDVALMTDNSEDYSKSLCTAMEGDDIEVFTIGFMLDNEGRALNLLRDCASTDLDTDDVKHFHAASNMTELNEAFDAIARNLEKLTLTH